jgi:uncharacterized SAM-binding protein YcdF (DUF218 family)
LGTTEAAGEWLTQSLLSPPAAFAVSDWPRRADGAVLVLGAGIRRRVPEYASSGLQELTAERLAYGVWLARETGLPLGFSGGIGWTARDLKESEASVVTRVMAQQYQMPLRWAEDRSRDTRENAANTLPLLAAGGVKRVLLVTHDCHMRRALRAFETVAAPLGLEIVAAPMGLRQDAYSTLSDWTPSAGGFSRVRYAVYEWLAWQMGR